jgi:hypothetical protein
MDVRHGVIDRYDERRLARARRGSRVSETRSSRGRRPSGAITRAEIYVVLEGKGTLG